MEVEKVVLHCPKCKGKFQVLADERFDHYCPHCNFGAPEFAGTDYFGNEIFVGDEIVVTPNGEVILADALEDFLIEVLGYKFKQAE